MREVFDCEQGTPEWHALRSGVPTASRFATVMASGRGGGESKTRMKYMRQLAAERLGCDLGDGFSNKHMDRGHRLEPEARAAYAMMRDVDPVQVGFIKAMGAGASPDSLIGDDGMLEIKTRLPDLQLELLDMPAREVPPEHVAQVQGQLWIAGREWCDFVSYSPGLRLFIARAYRDEDYIKKLSAAVHKFNSELGEYVSKHREAAA